MKRIRTYGQLTEADRSDLNMAGHRCGGCGETGPLFEGDAGERLARDTGAPLLARVPFDASMQAGVDQGDVAAAALALASAAEALVTRLDASSGREEPRASSSRAWSATARWASPSASCRATARSRRSSAARPAAARWRC
jgi:hypothetical protein